MTREELFARHCFAENWKRRHDRKPHLRHVHRYYAREAIRELRYLLGRPGKRQNVPTAYGHQGV